MLRELLQLRFRLAASRDARETVQTAVSASLGRSQRCKHWELLERPGESDRLVLHVQWQGDDDQDLFRSSPECSEFFHVLGSRVRGLEQAEYHVDETVLLAGLGGAQGMLRFVSDILQEVSGDSLLGARFGSRGGERFARLGLWLIEVLSGAKLSSLATSARPLRFGPMPDDPLDLEERAQLLQLARGVLHVADGRGHSAVSALEANLPLHPALPAAAVPRVKTGIRLRVDTGTAAPANAQAAGDARQAQGQRPDRARRGV